MSNSWKLSPFGETVEKIRKERGMPKAELCRRLDISTTYYALIIHGKRSEVPQKQNILNVLGMDMQKEVS